MQRTMKNNNSFLTAAIAGLRSVVCSVFPCFPKEQVKKSSEQLFQERVSKIKSLIKGVLPEAAIVELAMSSVDISRDYTALSYRSFQEGTVNSLKHSVPYIHGFLKYHSNNVKPLTESEKEDVLNFMDISGDYFTPNSLPLAENGEPDSGIRISVLRLGTQWKVVNIISVLQNETLIKTLRFNQEHHRENYY